MAWRVSQPKKIELHLHSLEKWRTPNQKIVTADPKNNTKQMIQ
jgi:hypothetical protein